MHPLYALDIGTHHTRIAQAGKGVVVSEATLIADCASLPVGVAVGEQARAMIGKMPDGLHLYRPFHHGHLAAPSATALLLKQLFRRLGIRPWARPSLRLVIPTQATAVERTQLIRAIHEAGMARVTLVSGPQACAHASGIEVSRLKSAAVIDIGASLTEVAVVSEQIVFRRNLRLGGSDFDEVIRDALNLEAGVEVSLARAREVKHVVGCVALPSDPDDLEVTGRDRTCGLPRKVNVPRALIYECLEAPLQRLEELLRGVLDQLSPLVCKDIQTDGLALAGGGAMLNGLPEHLERKLGMRFIRVPDPIHCAVLGALEVSEDQCEQPRH